MNAPCIGVTDDGADPDARASAAAALLEHDPSYRVLRRLRPAPAGPTGSVPVSASTRVVGVADVETTGLAGNSRIVELAVRRLRVDPDGSVVEVGRPHAFLEDPGEPLDPLVSRLTGLSDADLAGRSIDEAAATSVLGSCEVVVCHNAAFDAPRILARLPALEGLPFACSLHEVDWRARGFAGALNLSCLLCQSGMFPADAHRAGADVDTTMALLAHRDGSGRTALAELLERAALPTLRFLAVGAAFGEPKDRLKGRGYRWRPDARVWAREVAVEAGEEERAWLLENVYAARWRPWAAAPRVENVDWSNRHVG